MTDLTKGAFREKFNSKKQLDLIVEKESEHDSDSGLANSHEGNTFKSQKSNIDAIINENKNETKFNNKNDLKEKQISQNAINIKKPAKIDIKLI